MSLIAALEQLVGAEVVERNRATLRQAPWLCADPSALPLHVELLDPEDRRGPR